ncbi:MAG: cytidine deaminase [Chitinophagales bacterium]|nr:cytidine deaminase [Bacteroidota bacterium]MCB9256701.1 cytidine deaminase [Chitinophagales bacterium]
MKKIEISTEVFVYDDLNELREIEIELLEKAEEALAKAYAPYSEFLVGSAVLLENGEILNGANQENAAYSTCICAERTVLSAAATIFPKIKPVLLSVVVKNTNKQQDKPAAPCGECRQYIFEVESRFQSEIPILMKAQSNKIYKVKSASQLLPLAFQKSDLI